MGELLIQVLATGGEEPPFSLPGLPVDWPHAEAAEGWGGDRLNMYENADGSWAIAWQTAWDTDDGCRRVRDARRRAGQPTFDGISSISDGLRPDRAAIRPRSMR